MQAEVPVHTPTDRREFGEELRELCRDVEPAAQHPADGRLGEKAVGRDARDVPGQTVDVEASPGGLVRPVVDRRRIAQQHVDPIPVEVEPSPAVHDPSPPTRPMHLAQCFQRAEVDIAPVVGADIPITLWRLTPHRPRPAEHDRFYARAADQGIGQPIDDVGDHHPSILIAPTTDARRIQLIMCAHSRIPR